MVNQDSKAEQEGLKCECGAWMILQGTAHQLTKTERGYSAYQHLYYRCIYCQKRRRFEPPHAEFEFLNTAELLPGPSQKTTREIKALQIYYAGQIRRVKYAHKKFIFRDSIVDLEQGTCSCPDFNMRGNRCKHILAAEMFEEKNP